MIDVRDDAEVPDVLEIVRQTGPCLASHPPRSNVA
jgi:hypothetical protein